MELVELLYFFGVCLAYRDLPLARYLMAWRPGPAPLPAFLQSSQAGAETEFSVEQYQASGIPRCIGSRCCKWFLAASLHTLGSSKVITKVLLPSGVQTQLAHISGLMLGSAGKLVGTPSFWTSCLFWVVQLLQRLQPQTQRKSP